jgi:hypothetical protein
MIKNYIKIPIDTQLFEDKNYNQKKTKNADSCKIESIFEKEEKLRSAISQNLNLLFLSQEGELFFDKKFGLEVWNHNYESKKLKHDERKCIEEEIVRDLNIYEKRLKYNSHEVDVQFRNETKLLDGKKVMLHIIEIKIASLLNEKNKFRSSIFNYNFSLPVKVYYIT